MKRLALFGAALAALASSASAHAANSCGWGTTPTNGLWCLDSAAGTATITQGPTGLGSFSINDAYFPAGTSVIALQESPGSAVGNQVSGFSTSAGTVYGSTVSTKVLPVDYASGGSFITFGATDGYVYNLNATTGACVWRTFIGRTGATNIVDFGCSAGDVQNPCGDTISAEPSGLYSSTGAASASTVFVATNDGTKNGCTATENRVYALNAATGAITWTFNTPAQGNYSADASGTASVGAFTYGVTPDLYQETTCASNRNQLVGLDSAGLLWTINATTGVGASKSITGLAGRTPDSPVDLAYSTVTGDCGLAFVATSSGTAASVTNISLDSTICGGSAPCAAPQSGLPTSPSGLQTPIKLTAVHSGAAGNTWWVANASNGTTTCTYMEKSSVNCSYCPTLGTVGTPFPLSLSGGGYLYSATNEGSLLQFPVAGQPASGTCIDNVERFISTNATTVGGDPGADYINGSLSTPIVLEGDTAGRVSALQPPFTTPSVIANVTGLTGSVTLKVDGTALTAITTNGLHVLSTATAAHTITVGTAPTGETCTVNGAASASTTASSVQDANLTVACTPSTASYPLNVTVTGLVTSGLVLTQSKGTTQTLSPNASGSYTFPYNIASGTKYAVAVTTQPSGSFTCTVTNGSGTMASPGATISVACACPTGDSQCGTSCVNEQTDDNNCGGCNLTCNQTCTSGTCQYSTSAPGSDGLTVDATNIYWVAINGGIGQVWRLPKAGGTATQMWNGGKNQSPWWIVTDSTNAYWVNEGAGTADFMPITGTTSTTPTSYNEGNTPVSVAVDSTNMYWVDDSTIWKVPLVGGTPVTITSPDTGASRPCAIWYGSSRLVVGYQGGDESIWAMNTDGTNATELGTNQGYPIVIAGDTTNAYWANESGKVIAYAPIAGGTTGTLASGTAVGNPGVITTDGINVYWGNSTGGVYKEAIGDTSPTTMSSTSGNILGLAVDGTSLYWSNSSTSLIVKLTPK